MPQSAIKEFKYHLTFDIDWAPDFCISQVLDKLEDYGVKATFFVTHPSDIIKEIENKGHTIGLHPNFLPNSSHGSTTRKTIDYLLEIAPKATVLRTHALVQSSPLLLDIFSNYGQLKLDLSTFMYRFAYVGRFSWAFNNVSFERINYNWEDDAAFSDEAFDWSSVELFGDINILDFHPIHVALNSSNGDCYHRLKGGLNGKPLSNVSEKNLRLYINELHGASTYLDAILSSKARSISLEQIP
jgi:peptidoglycan/xylan/chitin deacetylase (PgdA/CDA1 family)